MHSQVVNSFGVWLGIHKRSLWRSSILSSYEACDHILLLLNQKGGDGGGLLCLVFLEQDFSLSLALTVGVWLYLEVSRALI